MGDDLPLTPIFAAGLTLALPHELVRQNVVCAARYGAQAVMDDSIHCSFFLCVDISAPTRLDSDERTTPTSCSAGMHTDLLLTGFGYTIQQALAAASVC